MLSLGTCSQKGALEYFSVQSVVRDCLGEFYNLLPQLGITDLQSQIDLCFGSDGGVLPDCEGCSVGEKQIVWGDHLRTRDMLQCAIDKLSSYDGKLPADVKNGLIEHFGGKSSKIVSEYIKFLLKYIKWYVDYIGADYIAEDNGPNGCPENVIAYTYPFIINSIKLCRPNYWNESELERSGTLIHEWMHLFNQAFDLAYDFDDEYMELNTLQQLLNADSFSELIKYLCCP